MNAPASDVRCLQCDESRDAIRASQRTSDPIYCAAGGYYGEVDWEFDQHRFRGWTDPELIGGWGILPEYVDLYRRVVSGWEIAAHHRKNRLDTLGGDQ